MIYTKYKRPEKKLTKNNQPPLVDRAGYIPAKRRIENLINAGKRLELSRREQYDYHDHHVDLDSPVDPLRRRGIDLAEITEIKQRVEPVMEELKKLDKKNKEDKLKAEQEALIEQEVQKRLSSLKTEKPIDNQ